MGYKPPRRIVPEGLSVTAAGKVLVYKEKEPPSLKAVEDTSGDIEGDEGEDGEAAMGAADGEEAEEDEEEPVENGKWWMIRWLL